MGTLMAAGMFFALLVKECGPVSARTCGLVLREGNVPSRRISISLRQSMATQSIMK